jgi:ABC-type sugar transport system substrate-binding protein
MTHCIRLSALALTAAVLLGGAAEAADGMRITLLNPFVADEFWQGCSVGAKRAAADVGATITELDANNQVQTQVNQLDLTLQQAPDAILISALDSKGMVPQLTRAMAAGIGVYAFNTAVPDAEVSATVAMDEVATGAAAAAKMVELLKERSAATGQTEFNLLHLVGAVATEAVRLRRDGFNQAIAQPVDGITIHMTEVITEWKPELAVNGVTDAMTKGKVDAIFTESDFLTPFIVPVMQRNGYTDRSGDNHIIIGGLGGIPGGLKAIRDGWQEFTLNYPIDGMCSSSVYLASAMHGGAGFAESWQDATAKAGLGNNDPRLVESDASGPSILLTANPIDASNVDSNAFWANTFKQ